MPNDELLRLAERVEALAGPDREVDLRIEAAINPDYNGMDDEQARFLTKYGGHPACTASLDAAMQLVPGGWSASFVSFPEGHAETGVLEFQGIDGKLRHAKSMADSGRVTASTPALALTAAALRARAHSGDTQ